MSPSIGKGSPAEQSRLNKKRKTPTQKQVEQVETKHKNQKWGEQRGTR